MICTALWWASMVLIWCHDGAFQKMSHGGKLIVIGLGIFGQILLCVVAFTLNSTKAKDEHPAALNRASFMTECQMQNKTPVVSMTTGEQLCVNGELK